MIAKFFSLRALVIAFGALSLAGVAAAQSYKVAASTAAVPSELAAPVRAALSGSALEVSGGSGPLCEIWLAKSAQAAATPDTSLGVSFGQIAQGSLVGAIKFDANASDYRGQAIKPGVYTLRYMLQPVDGNHQGVSPYRDYLLAVPAAADTSAATMATKDLLDASRKASGTGHPSVWSLEPPDSPPASLPAIVHQDSDDSWVVFFPAPVAKPVPMGLIVVGHSPES
ncbi:MAG TPA: hypothetical protein VN661_00560 [Candidatus Acidoferrales bacterium]|nr:hypothetical protein [Candidatus Acidoferrales bacterium]